MPRVVHFEIPVDEPERASAFYKSVFGWNIQKWDGPMPYWLIETGEQSQPGINGGFMVREQPNTPTINTIDVSSVDEYLEKVASSGGSVVMPKHAIPNVGYLAYCTDTEGNTFGIIQSDESAK